MHSSPETSSPWSERRVRWAVWGVSAAVLAVVALEMIVRTSVLPPSIHEALTSSPVIYDREGGVLATLPDADGGARAHFVGHLPDMGRWLPEVTVALEDHRFYEHSGIDLYAIGGAAWSDIKARRLHRGASTITQQLIKQELGKRGRQWRRKWREAVLALKLERSWSKAEILQGYLNRLDYGNRRFGAESASSAYFGKRCAALTLAEAIFLAGLPQAPSRYNPWRNPESAKRKYARSIDRLTKVGYLTGEQAAALLAAPPQTDNHSGTHRAPYFLEALERSQEPLAPLRGAIASSLDPAIQEEAAGLLEKHLTALNRPDVGNGAVVVLENASGRVRALSVRAVASAADTEGINAALTPRHAGSTLKPFVYQQALEERRFTAASVLTDTAEAVAAIYTDYDPQNYNRRYFGPVRLRDALGNSLNIPAILVSHGVGPRRGYNRLAAWGLGAHDSFEADGAGYVLGNRQVTLLDLSFAYSHLARGGRVTARPLFTEHEKPEFARLASEEACRLVEDMLCDNEARSHAFGARSVLRFPAGRRTAVKTGTSSNFRDAWVVGYDRGHTVGVWVGNLDGQSMGGALSVNAAGPVWRQMMDWLAVHRPSGGLEPLKPEEGLVPVEIDALTGLRPVAEKTRRTITEWFLQGTEPLKAGETWYDRAGNIVLPESYRAWCASRHNHLGARAVTSSVNGEETVWRITSPREGARFVIDPGLPRAQQVLPFITDHPSPEELHWYLNGRRLAGEGTASWALERGTWVLRAREPETGREVRHSFVVE